MEITINGDVYFLDGNDGGENSKLVSKEEIKSIRRSGKVSSSKKKVKSRDGYCQCCGESDKPLEVHHIFPLAKYPSLASDEENLIALCQTCHRKYHEMYAGSEGAATFAKFMKDYGTRIYGGI